MNLSSRAASGAMIVTVNEPRIDAPSAIAFKDSMRSLISIGTEDVVLDLSQVVFVDSSGLGAIVGSMKLMDAPRKLHLVGLTPDVDKVFRLTRMDSIFDIHTDVSAFENKMAG